jgi:hypothetical protein
MLILASSYGWYQTGRGLAFRVGLGEVATGIGVAAAVIVAITLVRWARGDAEGRALAALRCPNCAQRLDSRHEHATGSMPGRQLWSCATCGFGRMAPLTCEGCAA